MKALLFPFTFVSPQDQTLLKRFFEQVSVLRPCRSTGGEPSSVNEDMLLKIHYPYKGGDDQLLDQAAAFERWARQQQDVDLKQALLNPSTPFFDDSVTHVIASHVRAAYRQRGGLHADTDATPPSQFRSRLFLQIAHRFDVRTWEMAQSMAKLGTLESHLYESLHASEPAGEDLFADRQTLAYGVFNAYMITERISAWCDMAEHFLKANTAPTVLVTTSRAVIDHLAEQLPLGRTLMQLVCPLDKAPFGEIRDRIATLVADPNSLPTDADFYQSAAASKGPTLGVQLFVDAPSSLTESLSKMCDRPLEKLVQVGTEPSPGGVAFIFLTC